MFKMMGLNTCTQTGFASDQRLPVDHTLWNRRRNGDTSFMPLSQYLNIAK